MFYSKLKRKSYGFYTFHFLKSLDFNALNVGSAVPSMTTEMLNGMILILPQYDILEKFNDFSKTMNDQIKHKVKENGNLKNLSDLILAKMTKVEIEKEFVK